MAKIKAVNKTAKPVQEKKTFMEILCGIWIFAILFVQPLYFQDAYADILTAKYGFLLVADGVLLAGFIAWAIAGKKIGPYFANIKEQGLWNYIKSTFSVLDYFVLGFLLISIISTLQSIPYMYSAFFGNEGRWDGMITIGFYCISYFIISRNMKFKKSYITLFLIACLIAALWAITDFFDWNILGFKTYMSQDHYRIFVSTMGNIDTYNGFMAVPFAAAGALFILNDDKLISRVFNWVCFAVITVSMIVSSADNAYLAFAAFFIFIPLAAFRKRSGIRRYLITAATLLSALATAQRWSAEKAGQVMWIDGFFQKYKDFSTLKYIAAAVWVIAIAFCVYDIFIKKIPQDALAPKYVKTGWLCLVIAGGCTAVTLFVLANFAAPIIPSFLEPVKSFIQFTDEWGTWRGYVWKKFIEIYFQQPFHHILFGTGPETAAIYLYNYAYMDVAGTTGMIYDIPHNESLQMFFNMGPIGFITWTGMLISPIALAVKTKVKKVYPYIAAIGFAGLCHFFSAFVNITTPIELASLIGLIAVAGNLYRFRDRV